MDHSKLAIPFEIAKMVLGLFVIYTLKGWYGIDEFLPYGTLLLSIYIILSLGLTFYFKHRQLKIQKPMMRAI
jgi:hypothetical protein